MNATEATITEVQQWYCQYCREPIPDDTNRSTHEKKCTCNPANIAMPKIGMRYNKVKHESINDSKNNPRNVKQPCPAAFTIYIGKTTRDEMARYIPRFFMSVSEIIRAAMLERALHPGDFNVENDDVVGEHAAIVSVTRTTMLDTMLRKRGMNHSAYIRATVRQYLVILKELKTT